MKRFDAMPRYAEGVASISPTVDASLPRDAGCKAPFYAGTSIYLGTTPANMTYPERVESQPMQRGFRL